MKHIQRKFRNEIQQLPENFKEDFDLLNREEVKVFKHKKGMSCYYQTADKTVEAFQVRINGKYYYIPEPDPILIYFDSAQRHLTSIIEEKKAILKLFDLESAEMKLNVHKIYIHFELCVVFVTALFTSVEAFLNKIIPNDHIYEDPKKNRTEIYNKDQIQRFVSFDTKIKTILRDVTKKDFQKQYPNKYQHIDNLKEFRDAIIHTKTSLSGNTSYDDLFKRAFTFKYEESLHAVRDFINYYEEDYVIECGCGADF